MYYIHETSVLKCCALDDIACELKLWFEPFKVPRTGGIHPLHACETRFVAHKVASLERMIDRFGTYLTTHLVSMTEDDTVKAVDQHKPKGYI